MALRLMYQLAVDLGTNGHLDQIVIHIADYPGRRTQFDALRCDHIATYDSVEYDKRH